MFHILSLNKRNEVFSKYNLETEDSFRKFSKINIFIGANNSGKSRLLREIYRVLTLGINNDKPFEKDIDFDLVHSSELILALNKCLTQAKRHLSNPNLLDVPANELIAELDQRRYFNYADTQTRINDFPKIVETLKASLFSESGRSTQERTRIRNNRAYFEQDLKKFSEQIHSLVNENIKKVSYHATYIPMLRGLRKISSGNEEVDNFKFRTHADYFKGIDYQKSDIFTGIKLYDDIKKYLLSDYDERQTVIEFETFLSDNFFNGERISIIPRQFVDKVYARDNADNERNSDVYIKIGEEEEFPIYLLGDGIQSIIILTFPLFAHRDKRHILFIEEPELSLHPGMQRTFIETINQFENAQVFIATHSNHFLDMTLEASSDISVFSFQKKLPDGKGQRKKANFIVQNVTNPEDSVLELIGVRNSSVFLSNCTIWVEGVTDRYYIRKYLELYQLHQKKLKEAKGEKFKEYKEDIHFSFVEYSGSNMDHWSFLEDPDPNPIHKNINVERVCGKLFLITDKDKGKDEKHDKLLEKLTKERYYCLKRKEIENLLKPEIIKKTVEDFEIGAHNKEKLIFEEFDYPDYAKENLGEFIDKMLSNKKIITYKDGNTIVYKTKFAKRAIKHMRSHSDISKDADEIANLLYQFIASWNK